VKFAQEQAKSLLRRVRGKFGRGPAEEALQLQRPLTDNELIVLPQPRAEEEQPLLL